MTLRVLVADDNPDSANTLAHLVARMGCEVAVAYDGKQALDEALRFNPDVLLLDIQMPFLDGLQVAHHLRATPSFENKLLIAVSGHSEQSDLDRASKAQYDEYLIKPIKWETLQKILDEAASRISTPEVR
jgi:CheY-like chemotaxis protein